MNTKEAIKRIEFLKENLEKIKTVRRLYNTAYWNKPVKIVASLIDNTHTYES